MQNEPGKIRVEGTNLESAKLQKGTKTWKKENQRGATNNEV